MLAEELNSKIPAEVCGIKAGGEIIKDILIHNAKKESAIWRFSIDLNFGCIEYYYLFL
ncbi:MAG TPA: hypothetical protein VE076_01605 [Nitrososphaeraceae archaeon]|nr:hypothetical protein [Nitrososphaeraceae archaeon]